VTFEFARKKVPVRPPKQYYSDPDIFAKDFVTLSEKVATEGSKLIRTTFTPEILFAYLSTDFSFGRFRENRSALARLDEKLAAILTESQGDIIANLFQQSAEPGHKSGVLLQQVTALRSKPAILSIFQNAALESNPIRKLNQFTVAAGATRAFISSAFPKTVELGEDEMLPCTIAAFVIANPPFIVSNEVFIMEFTAPEAMEAVFNLTLAQVSALFKEATNHLPGFHLEKFLKRKRK
jgi:hypothetical protein